jgi:hypothetical protein
MRLAHLSILATLAAAIATAGCWKPNPHTRLGVVDALPNAVKLNEHAVVTAQGMRESAARSAEGLAPGAGEWFDPVPSDNDPTFHVLVRTVHRLRTEFAFAGEEPTAENPSTSHIIEVIVDPLIDRILLLEQMAQEVDDTLRASASAHPERTELLARYTGGRDARLRRDATRLATLLLKAFPRVVATVDGREHAIPRIALVEKAVFGARISAIRHRGPAVTDTGTDLASATAQVNPMLDRLLTEAPGAPDVVSLHREIAGRVETDNVDRFNWQAWTVLGATLLLPLLQLLLAARAPASPTDKRQDTDSIPRSMIPDAGSLEPETMAAIRRGSKGTDKKTRKSGGVPAAAAAALADPLMPKTASAALAALDLDALTDDDDEDNGDADDSGGLEIDDSPFGEPPPEPSPAARTPGGTKRTMPKLAKKAAKKSPFPTKKPPKPRASSQINVNSPAPPPSNDPGSGIRHISDDAPTVASLPRDPKQASPTSKREKTVYESAMPVDDDAGELDLNLPDIDLSPISGSRAARRAAGNDR